MKSTNQNISRAIYKETGKKGVKLSSLGGCVRFYNDDDESMGNELALTNAVCVCYITHLTVDQWVDAFKEAWESRNNY